MGTCRRRPIPLLQRTTTMTTSKKNWLPGRTLSDAVSGPEGQPALMIEALEIAPGQNITLTFESVGPRWRQGVFLVTNGQLSVAGTSNRALTLWSDTAPSPCVINVAETDGWLVLYNIWDSGRGRRRFESQSATCGMLVETLEDGSRRYSCTDVGWEPDFTRLVFRVSIE